MKKMTLTSIAEMTDEEVYNLSIPHPEARGQRAFTFTLQDFESRAEMAACMAALVARLRKINS
jgi:hypothetical protein